MSLSNNYPTTRPSLTLDFANTNMLDPRITFTRSSIATVTNSLGLIQTVQANAPRFDYDPVTLAARGLLIEEQRTNLQINSNDFNVWSKSNVTVVLDGTEVSPSGANDANKITLTSTSGSVTTNPAVAFSAGVHTSSVYAKKGNTDFIVLRLRQTGVTDIALVRFNLANGTIESTTAGSGTITAVGNGWYRCTVTGTAAAANHTTIIYPNNTTGQASGEYVFCFGAQLEAGSFATSYIPTVASQVTRSPDLASVNTLSPWYNATEGTLYAEYSHATTSTNNPAAVSINANTSAEEIIIYGETTLGEKFFVRSGNVIQANITASAKFANGVTGKLAGAYKVNDFAASANGAAAVVDTSGSIPTVTQMNIGSEFNGTLPLNGHIRRITYYPVRLSNTNLQALTS